MSSGFRNDGIQVAQYLYDFSVDGGSVSDIALSSKDGYKPLPQGAIVLDVIMRVTTAVTTSASGTLSCGNATSRTAYHIATAAATLADDYAQSGGVGVGALIWDNTNDAPIPFVVNSANDAVVSVSIATGALTAGVVQVLVMYLLPTAD